MKLQARHILAAGFVVLFILNHGEYYLRARRIRLQAQAQDAPVVHVDVSATGHNSITIDEQSLGNRGFLHFNTLESWAYSKDTPTACPEPVMQANGRQVKLMGFMYPLQPAGTLTVFCLLRSTQTCCYGPRPQYNQYVLVEMPQAVQFERLAPVVVEGRFFVDPKPDDGYIYRMEGSSVRLAVPNDRPVSATEFATQNNLPIFDVALLEKIKTASDKEGDVAALASESDGRQMVVQGFLVGKTQDAPPKIMIGKYAWDGKGKGTPPSLYNTVLVSLKGPSETPPIWWQDAVFKGTIHVTREPAERSKKGIISLQDAVLAVPPASQQGVLVDTGPVMPVLYEFMILAGYGGTLLVRRFSGRSGAGVLPAASGENK
jgi:hypothetical protein